MKTTIFKSITLLGLTLLIACAQQNTSAEPNAEEVPTETVSPEKIKPKQSHNYGGWYCPDNLYGFPPVDIKNWENVPVINGRMATKEETQTEASLIYIDPKEYPFAHVLPIKMPKLARYYNYSSQKEELIIVIQAMSILEDSIVGFRYLNGGNGSAHLNEVTFLNDDEIEKITPSQFVSFSIDIEASQEVIWKVLTEDVYAKDLQPIFDSGNKLNHNWKESSKVNYKYMSDDAITAKYADILFGNHYIQIDGQKGDYQYVEKFLLMDNQDEQTTEFQIVCGPYKTDFEAQKTILNKWAQKVKALSEKE